MELSSARLAGRAWFRAFALLALQSPPGCTDTLLPSLDNQERSQQIAWQPRVCVCVSVFVSVCVRTQGSVCLCVCENPFPFVVSNVAWFGDRVLKPACEANIAWDQNFPLRGWRDRTAVDTLNPLPLTLIKINL